MAHRGDVTAADLLPTDRPIVLFDGVCNLCNGLVQFVLPRDRDGRFRFAPLQSLAGQVLLEHFDLATDEFDTFVLVDGRRVYTRSEAALRLLEGLGGPWRALGVLTVVPSPLRDAVYDLVAGVRYDVFGRRDRCARPAPGDRDRFVEGADILPDEDAG